MNLAVCASRTVKYRDMRLLYRLIVGLLFLSVITGCTPSEPRRQPVLNVGMLLARGGLGDRSFNDSAYSGLQQAQKLYGSVRFETVDYTSDAANLEALRRFAREEYDLIIGVGFENAGYIETVAKEFPARKFAIIDVAVEGGNVTSVVYREQEGDFLMGVLAAMLTQSKKVGFIGGADIPIIRRIEQGFAQGVAFQDSSVTIVSELAGTFTEPETGKKLAMDQYEDGVDVIYNAAGRTGLGIIDAAKESGKLTIGTSGDQRYLAPGNVAGNRPKRVDTAVLTLIKEVMDGRFAPGIRSLGLQEGGLSIGPFDENIVTAPMRQRLEELEKKLIAGEITVKVE